MVRFLRWLDEQMQAGATVTEMDIDRQLTAFRAEQPGFEQPSFATIAAYGAHGAIVHYEADEKSNATLQPHGLLLLDSGGQYASGTTDITRNHIPWPLDRRGTPRQHARYEGPPSFGFAPLPRGYKGPTARPRCTH